MTKFFLLVFLAAASPQLTGRVVDQDDQPIERAIVVISTAKPRIGPSTLCPSCYPDCSKRTLTDNEGRFKIEGISSKLLFSLAAGASGYQGLVSKHFDPADSPEIKLTLQPLPSTPDVKLAVGKVIDAAGDPIVGAEVRSRTIYRYSGRIGGGDSSVTPLTLTDSDGTFQLTTGPDIRSLDLRVTAAGHAPSQETWERRDDKALTIKMGRGASIRGRLLLDQKPLAAVELGLVQRNRTIGNIVTPAEVSTDQEGYFQFDQLPPNIDYTVYTHTGQGSAGVLPVSLVLAPSHGERAILGDLKAQAPQRLSITVRTEDGSPLPDKGMVYVGRRDAWRGTQLNLTATPTSKVELDDVSGELFNISVRLRGYEVVRTSPPLNKDLNGRYGVKPMAYPDVVFVVRKQGEPAKPTQELPKI